MGSSVRPETDQGTGQSVLSGAQWSAAQSAPVSTLAGGDDPGKQTTNGLGRTLTGAEWSEAQKKTPNQLQAWKIPALPKAARDVTRTPADPNTKGQQIPGFGGELLRQTVDPALEHPLLAAALPVAAAQGPLAAAAVGAYAGGSMLTNIALYGYQKYLEVHASPDARAEMEADPERVSGQAAAAQALLLGLGPLLHVGVQKAAAATDFGAGVMEAGAEGVKETNFAPRFSEGFQDATDRSRFAAQIERGAAEATPDAAAGVKPPKGLETNAVPNNGKRAVSGEAPEGLIVPNAVKPGKVKPIQTEPASAPLQEAADVNAAVRDYQAQRVGEDTQDIAEERRAAAERLLGLREEDAARIERETSMLIRRRPGGNNAQAQAPLFESPEGAQLLGSMAARKGMSDDASPYPPTSRLDVAWKSGHDAVTTEAPADPSTYPPYPEGFTMGGALTDNRIPSDYTPPRFPKSEPPVGFQPTAQGDATANRESAKVARQPMSEDPRYGDGSRRPVHLVTVRGLVKELVDLEDKRVDAAGRAIYNVRQDENFHSTEDGRGVVVADRRGGGPSRQAKALQNLEDYARIDREVTEHLVNQRGIPKDMLDELLMREREARHDNQAAEEEGGDTSFDFGHSGDEGAGETSDEQSATEPTTNGAGSGASLETVEGTGETRTRGLAAGVEEKALAHHLALTVGDLPEYRRLSMADQAERATALLRDDPELARRVATGEAPAPHGLLPESVFTAVEQQAIAEGDVATLRELATGKLTAEATTMGQRIRALAERDPDSPVAAIQDVVNTRSGGAENRATVERATNDEVDAIAKHLDAVPVHGNAWNHLIDTLRC